MSEKAAKIVRGSSALALKAGFWYVVSNFLVKGLSFITTPIFSRLMSTEAFGEFSNFTSWQTTLLIITGFELHNTVGRAYYDFTDDFDGYVSTQAIATCLLTTLFYVLFLLCGDFIYNIVAIPPQLVHFMFITLMAQGCKYVFQARERTLYHYKTVAALAVINLVIPTALAVLMVVLADEGMRFSARVYGTFVPLCISGLGLGIWMILKGRKWKWSHFTYAMKLAVPLLAHYLTGYLLTSSNTIVTRSVMGAEATALVSMASSVIHILTILLQSVSGALTTWLMDNLNQNKMGLVRKGMLIYVGGVAVASIGVMLVSPELIWILGGSQYLGSVTLLPGLIVAAFVQAVTTVFTIILTYGKKVVHTALYTAVMAVLSIVAKVFLLPRFGLWVLPFINIAAFAVLFVANYILVRNAGFAKGVHLKGYLAMTAGVLAMMGACYFLYDHTVLRYAVIGVIGLGVLAVAYRYRAQIIALVRKKSAK